jgi:hypothetical protein
MSDNIISNINSLPIEELEHIDKYIKTKIRYEKFKKRISLQKRRQNVLEKLTLIEINEMDEWLYYEVGLAEEFIWKINDTEEIITLKYIYHSSKHTSTYKLYITYNNEEFVFEIGHYANKSKNNFIFNWKKLSDILNIPYRKNKIMTKNILRLIYILSCGNDELYDILYNELIDE